MKDVHNPIHIQGVYVDSNFLVKEIVTVCEDQSYDFKQQLNSSCFFQDKNDKLNL